MLERILRVQFLRYCIVGVTNAIVDIVIYYLLSRYAGLGGGYVYVAKTISFAVAILNSFIWNRLWTFGITMRMSVNEFAKYYAAVGSGVVINVGVHVLNISFFGLNDIVSVIIAALCTAVWGFSLVRLFVFR